MTKKKVTFNPINAFANFVKSFDYYGYKIEFNYQNRESEYRTFSGGFFSIVVRLFVVLVLLTKLYELLTS